MKYISLTGGKYKAMVADEATYGEFAMLNELEATLQ